MIRSLFNGLWLIAGICLLLWVFGHAELGAALSSATSLGVVGFVAVLAIYLVGFALDVVVWMIVFPGERFSAAWFWRLFKTRLLGEAINISTPVAGFGGEPAKAVILNRRYHVAYTEAVVSMIIATTITVIGLAGFLAAGLVLMIASGDFDAEQQTAAAVSFALLAAGIGGFFLVQRFGLSTRLARWAHGRTGLRWLERAAERIGDVDGRLVAFYRGRPLRLVGVIALAVAGYAASVGEVYVALYAIGTPVTVGDAWVIEAAAQLMRAAAFMIPGALGAQDGAFIVVTAAITGRIEAGAALALIRRARELVWVAWGAAVGGLEFLRMSRRSA